jgi:hypothetical protein
MPAIQAIDTGVTGNPSARTGTYVTAAKNALQKATCVKAPSSFAAFRNIKSAMAQKHAEAKARTTADENRNSEIPLARTTPANPKTIAAHCGQDVGSRRKGFAARATKIGETK